MIILPDDKAIIEMLTPEDAKQVFLALLSEDEVDLSPQAMIVYTVIHGRNDRFSKKQAENGGKGGAPKGNQNAKKQPKQAKHEKTTQTTQTSHDGLKQPKQASDTDTDTDTEPKKDLESSSVRNEEPLRTVEDEKPPDEPSEDLPPSEESMDDKPLGRDAATVSQVTELWNETLVPLGFRSLKKPSPARTRHFNARIREGPERRSLSWWLELLTQIANSSWLVDQARKKVNWLDFDWVINPSNLTKILEGKYDSNPDNPVIDDRLWCVKGEDGSHGEFYYGSLEDAERNAKFKQLRDEKASLMKELMASRDSQDSAKMARIEELKILMGLQPGGGETAYG